MYATAVALVSAGCGGDSTGVDVLPAELVGTWVAGPACSPVCNYTLTSIPNPSVHTDLVATAGVTIELAMNATGAAALNLAGQIVTGSAKISNGALILASGGSVDTVDYTVANSKLTLSFRSPILYDLNGDGTTDSAHASAVLNKQ
jgi:hypothetical protein